LGGRILAVADVFDALTTDRSYRIGWSEEEALDYIRKNAGHHFDPQIVEAFFAVLERSPRLHIVDDTDERGTPPVPDPVTLGITRASFEYLSLYEISQTISATLNLEDTLTLLAEKIRKLFNATDCILLMPDAHGNLKVARCSGHHEQWFMEQGVYSGEGYTYRVLKTGEGYCGPFDSRDMPRYTDGVDTRFLPLRSVMVAPLLVDGEVFGTVNLYHERENAFDPEDMQVLCSVGAQSGRAIRNAQEYDRTLKSAYTDSLTGLPNARQLMISLDKAVEEARLGQYLLTILVLDLDDFKPVNDRYGHLTGNQVLTDIGQILHDSLRSGDFVARYAGDEFVVVLPKAGVSEAETVADKLRAAVTAYRPASPALADLQVGVSIGYAVFPTDGTDSIALIASADRAMYQDKNRRKHTTLTASLLTATK
jgi:diguanylate cyclase (GGDEF)-like protein